MQKRKKMYTYMCHLFFEILVQCWRSHKNQTNRNRLGAAGPKAWTASTIYIGFLGGGLGPRPGWPPSTIWEKISLQIQHVCQGGLFRHPLFASNLWGQPKGGRLGLWHQWGWNSSLCGIFCSMFSLVVFSNFRHWQVPVQLHVLQI